MIILGIDPGSSRIGIGIIEKKSGRVEKKSAFLLTDENSFKDDEGRRLLNIEKKLNSILKKTKPRAAAIETLFFSKNKKTAFSVAQARGVILKTLAEKNIPVIELTPNQIKSYVAGNGNASKKEVAKMVGYSLSMDVDGLIDDVTDALAAALAASFVYKNKFSSFSAH